MWGRHDDLLAFIIFYHPEAEKEMWGAASYSVYRGMRQREERASWAENDSNEMSESQSC